MGFRDLKHFTDVSSTQNKPPTTQLKRTLHYITLGNACHKEDTKPPIPVPNSRQNVLTKNPTPISAASLVRINIQLFMQSDRNYDVQTQPPAPTRLIIMSHQP